MGIIMILLFGLLLFGMAAVVGGTDSTDSANGAWWHTR